MFARYGSHCTTSYADLHDSPSNYRGTTCERIDWPVDVLADPEISDEQAPVIQISTYHHGRGWPLNARFGDWTEDKQRCQYFFDYAPEVSSKNSMIFCQGLWPLPLFLAVRRPSSALKVDGQMRPRRIILNRMQTRDGAVDNPGNNYSLPRDDRCYQKTILCITGSFSNDGQVCITPSSMQSDRHIHAAVISERQGVKSFQGRSIKTQDRAMIPATSTTANELR